MSSEGGIRSNLSKWDADTTLKFLKMYRKHQCLWNKKNKYYKDKEVRMNALHDIKENMDLSDLDIPLICSKIRTLRTTYTEECKKIQKRYITKGEYKTQLEWFFFADSFLRDVVQYRGMQNMHKAIEIKKISKKPISKSRNNSFEENSMDYNYKSDSNDPLIKTVIIDDNEKGDGLNYDQDNDDGGDMSIIEIKKEPYNDWIQNIPNITHEPETNFIKQNNLNSTPNDTNLMRKEKNNCNNASVVIGKTNNIEKDDNESTINISEVEYNNYNNQNNIDDEFDIFGKSVASQLKKLPLDKAYEMQLRVQYLLTNAKITALGKQMTSSLEPIL